MTRAFSLATVVLFLSYLNVQGQDSPQIQKSTEKPNAAEAKAIRIAIITQGPTTASRSVEEPYPRILIIPKDVSAAYAMKPEATVRLLLKIGEGGEPMASMHAFGCIDALISGPEFGWLSTMSDPKTWDDPIADGRETFREFSYNGCLRLIAKKESKEAESAK